jgi:gliding motility-associated-like protein
LNYVTTLPDDDSQIKVNWNASGDSERAYGYQLHKQARSQEQVNTYALKPKDSSFVDDHVLTNQHSYEYRISGTNACGRPITSNSHATILLNGTKDQNGIRLDWRHYKGWEQNGIQAYKIARKVDDENQDQVYERLGAGQTNKQLEIGLDGYHQCYRIIAAQRAGNAQSWSNENCFDFEAKVHIPNAFSPNEDMINDQYMIEGYNLKEFRIRIYNRWGEEVFSSQSLDETWDGTYKDQKASPGKYIVLIKYRGNSEIQSYEGLLHLIR